MAVTDIKITQTDIDNVAIHTSVAGDRLSGSVLENKQVFDNYPDMIVEHFNELCDYAETLNPEGDCGLNYTTTEITFICNALGCRASDITL